MAVRQFAQSPIEELRLDPHFDKRSSRWRFFRVAFVFLYVGVLLDVVTTALGEMKMGSGYEQNPLGFILIGKAGWFGLAVVLTGLCLICYVSFRTVYWRMSTRWSAILNAVLVPIILFRWLAVVTAVIFIVQ